MTCQNAGTGRQYYMDEMGNELGPVFYSIAAEVNELHKKWSYYVALFGTKPERIDLLNKAAPGLFRYLQDTLFDDVVLHLARLTGSPESMGKSNLTIERLLEEVRDQTLRVSLRDLREDIKLKTRFCKDWRNRRLAHDDFALGMSHPSALPLEAASRLAVREALELIATLLSQISDHYTSSGILFRIKEPLDANRLLYILDDGLRAMAERHARLSEGREYRAEDFAPRDL